MSPIDRLDPILAKALAALPFEHMDAARAATIRGLTFDVPLSDDVERTDHTVPGHPDVAGLPPVPVRVHRPCGVSGPMPCLLHMHGGGYVIGTYGMDDPMFDRLCPKVGLVGVSVEYRLAPDTPYPGPLEDCYRALVWVHEHADELGIDRDRVGVGGLSAGGGMAAALALFARDRGEVPVAFQLLDSPMIDDRQATFSSQQDDLPVWSRQSNAFGWQSYLGDLYGTDDVPPTAAPARATDLSNLPPTFISVGELDGFLDEDVDYALRLIHAGVSCELHVYPGASHGYLIAANSDLVRRARRDVEEWLARQVGTGG